MAWQFFMGFEIYFGSNSSLLEHINGSMDVDDEIVLRLPLY